MNFDTEWHEILENLGGESEIREMAREQGFLGWRHGVIQPIIGFDEIWMDKPEIVGLGIIVPTAILCMSRDLEDFERAEWIPSDYLGTHESVSQLLLDNRKAMLALDMDIVEAEEMGWIELLTQVRIYKRSNNIEGFQLRGVENESHEVLADFIDKIHEMLQELQVSSEIVTESVEEGFSEDFQNEWA